MKRLILLSIVSLFLGNLAWAQPTPITPRSYVKKMPTVAAGIALTPNVSNDGVAQSNTAGAGTWTINAPTGTPYVGKTYLMELKATNAQTFSWNAAWTDSVTCAKPATIGAGKTIWVGFVYSAINTAWYCTIYAELD